MCTDYCSNSVRSGLATVRSVLVIRRVLGEDVKGGGSLVTTPCLPGRKGVVTRLGWWVVITIRLVVPAVHAFS